MPENMMNQEQQQRQKDLYVVTPADYAQVGGVRRDIDDVNNVSKVTKLRRKNKLGEVCQHISTFMPEVYTDFEKIVSQKQSYGSNPEVQDAKVLELKCNRGTRMGEENDIIDFSLAGSGYDQFRREHKGENQVGHGKTSEQTIRKKIQEEYENKKKVGRWRKFWNFFAFKSSQYYQNTERMKQEDAQLLENIREKYQTGYSDEIEKIAGKKDTVVGKFGKIEEVRKRESAENRIKYTISGPIAGLKKGMSNSGTHSIELNRKYVLELAANYLEPKFEQWKNALDNNQPIRPVLVRLKGHSRGGVGAVEGAMMIRAWVNEHYPNFLDYVKFDLTQFDPVPGTGSASGINQTVDLKGDKTVTYGGDKFLGLGDSAETTVIYTALSNHDSFFTPQKVLGAKRIFISLDTHDVGLQHVDRNKSQRNGEWEETGHAQVYMDMETATAYSQSSLNDMPPGVYLVDAKNRVIRVKSPEMAEFMVRKMRTEQKDGKDTKESTNQSDRRDVILDSVKDWFKRDDTISPEERNQTNIGLYLRSLKDQGIAEFQDDKYEALLKVLEVDLTAEERVDVLSRIYGEVSDFQKENKKVGKETVENLLKTLSSQVEIYASRMRAKNEG